MPTIAVLSASAAFQEDVARQLKGLATLENHERSTALVGRASAGRLDAVVTELDDEEGRSIAPTVVELSARRPNLPVVIYGGVNIATLGKVMAVLTPGLRVELAVRPHEPLQVVIHRVLSPHYRPGAAPVLLQRFLPHAPPGLRTFVALAVLAAPVRRSVEELSLWSGVTARTIERRLVRARWPAAHTVLQSFIALDAVWLMAEYGWSARRVQRIRGFPHESSVTRLLARYAATRPSTLREDGGFPAALAHVGEVLSSGEER